MNPYPPFPRRFDGGPGTFAFHEHVATNPALAWATFALVLLLVLTFGAVIVARLAGGGRRRHGHFRLHGGDPLEVVRMRFASGQISRDEYLQATSDLTAHHVAPPPEATA